MTWKRPSNPGLILAFAFAGAILAAALLTDALDPATGGVVAAAVAAAIGGTAAAHSRTRTRC